MPEYHGNMQTRTRGIDGPIRLGVVAILAFFGGIGTWAAVAPLDGAIIGNGSLAVHGNVKSLQHREGGRVSQMLVQEGDWVAKDQVLVKLDTSQVLASMNVHVAQLTGDRAMYARDLAELSNATRVTFPSDLDKGEPLTRSAMDREQLILASHQLVLKEQLEIIDERFAQTQKQLAGTIAQHNSAIHALEYGTEQLRAMQLLERMGLAARNSVLELLRSLETLQGDTGQLEADIGRHEAELGELRAEKLRVRAAAQSDIIKESREAQLRINDVLPRIEADRDQLSHLQLRAPVSGHVVDLQVFTNGGVVEPGKAILRIVPDARQVVAIAQIRPEDVEHLRSGQRARIIPTGFDARDNLPIDGRILSISADRLIDARTGNSYYNAEVSLGDDHQSGALLRQLAPGMPVQVIVAVKPRTALGYILDPFSTTLRSAGHEM